MKFIKFYILVFALLLFAVFVYAKNETLKTELFFWDWSNETLSLYITGATPGHSYNFDVKIKNVSDSNVFVHMWFVDGAVTNDSYHSKACLHEWYWDKVGQYISGPNDFGVSAKSYVIKTYTLSLPSNYSFSGEINACVTHYPALGNDSGIFSMSARRANFLDIYVNPSNVSSWDTTLPYIQSISPNNWQSSISTNSNIVIIFSESMNHSSVESSIILNPTVGILWFNWLWNTLTITHSNLFVNSTSYNFRIWTWAKDLAGNSISSVYSINFTTEASAWWWGGWWGWWWGFIIKPTKDNCPDWDNSGDLYDGDCGEFNEVENDQNQTWDNQNDLDNGEFNWSCSVSNSDYSFELNQAYTYACNVWITTMPDIQLADMMWPLLRKHLAKMISEFSMQVLWNKPDVNKVCVFSDIDQESVEMKYYMKTSCQLYLMGLHPDGITPKDVFDPDDVVTRAQFGTVLSRLLRQTQYVSLPDQLYYFRHLEALKNNNIMTQIYGEWPSITELRWYVMLMMMRVNENKLADEYLSNGDKISKWWVAALLDEGNLNVILEWFEDNIYYTDVDFIPIKWTINSEWVSKIRVSHMDSNGIWVYNNYFLQKFKPWDKKFVFYAYKRYNSLTLNDVNKYIFDFFDKDGKLMFTKTVWIDHNYVKNR